MSASTAKSSENISIRERLHIASHGQLRVFDGKTILSLLEFGFSMDELYRFIAPRRTLARRLAKGEPLTVDENDGALRLVRVVELAERVFAEPAKARRWLRKPNRALEGIVPIDLLESETGAHIVEQALHRIDNGIFA